VWLSGNHAEGEAVHKVEFPARAIAAALVLSAAGAAFGQATFPTKPVRLVASEAGGGGDFSARVIAQALTPGLGQQVFVDNRPGGVFAGDLVAKSSPDGYTLLNYGNTFWLLPLMRDSVPYDPLKDFVPVAVTIRAVTVMVIHPSIPAKTVKEFIAIAKARPGALNYGSGSAGSSNHLSAELFKYLTKTNIVRIPFKGIGTAMNALVSGEIQLVFPLLNSAIPHVNSGRLRSLGVTSAQPSELAPGMPTVASAGLPGFDTSGTYGIFAPARTPPAIVNRLHQEIAAVMKNPEIRQRFANVGMETVGGTPEQLAAFMRNEIAVMGKVIREQGIRDQ
jgi:tripartite-type tricarboxylate transporter receptor subunit TctC